MHFSRLRSKGSRFTLGFGGWGVRCRSQPSAAVRNRPREVAIPVPLASAAKVVTFGGFKRHVTSFRGAGVALRDSNMFHHDITCQKYRRLLRRFQTMTCTFRGRRSTLDVSIFILRGCVVAFWDMWWKLAEAFHETSVLRWLRQGNPVGKR